MRSYENDPTAALVSLAILISLCSLVFVLAVSLITLVAVYLLGWGLTYGLIRAVDWLTDNKLSDNEFVVLVLAPIFWASVVWGLLPDTWVYLLASSFAWPLEKTWLILVITGGVLGLNWGFLSLLLLDDDRQGADTLDMTGMLPLSEGRYNLGQDDLPLDLLQEGVLIGEDF